MSLFIALNVVLTICISVAVYLLYVCVCWELAVHLLNILRPRQNGRYFVISQTTFCIFLNENIWIPIEIPLKSISKGPVKNIPALVQIMAWRRPGGKPLSEPMMVSSQTDICVARPQWVKSPRLRYSFAKMLLLARSCRNRFVIHTRHIYCTKTHTNAIGDNQRHHCDMILVWP